MSLVLHGGRANEKSAGDAMPSCAPGAAAARDSRAAARAAPAPPLRVLLRGRWCGPVVAEDDAPAEGGGASCYGLVASGMSRMLGTPAAAPCQRPTNTQFRARGDASAERERSLRARSIRVRCGWRGWSAAGPGGGRRTGASGRGGACSEVIRVERTGRCFACSASCSSCARRRGRSARRAWCLGRVPAPRPLESVGARRWFIDASRRCKKARGGTLRFDLDPSRHTNAPSSF